VLVASLVEDSMSLSSVFVDLGVHKLNDVVSDGCSENGWHWDTVNDFR